MFFFSILLEKVIGFITNHLNEACGFNPPWVVLPKIALNSILFIFDSCRLPSGKTAVSLYLLRRLFTLLHKTKLGATSFAASHSSQLCTNFFSSSNFVAVELTFLLSCWCPLPTFTVLSLYFSPLLFFFTL